MTKGRIKIRRTIGEFEMIDYRLEEMKKGDLTNYLRCSIRNLVKTFKDCPDCITSAYGEKIEIAHRIDNEDSHKILKQISFIMGKPISSIIDDFFIAPLLLPKME